MIVSNSSPLIYLSKIGRLNLLKSVYTEILIPKGVYKETVTDAIGKPGVSEIQKAISEKWIKLVLGIIVFIISSRYILRFFI